MTKEDMTSSIDKYAYVCLEPPRGLAGATSYFNQWQDSSAGAALIYAVLPSGSIIDFFFDWFLDDVGIPSAGPAIVGASAGVLYHKNIVLGGSSIQVVLPLNNI
jgi:hypothetical protein